MSQEIEATMIAIGIGAFVIGLIVGRWPTWSVKRRFGMLAGAGGVLFLVALWWGTTLFPVIPAHSVTYNQLLFGGHRYFGASAARGWAQGLKDGWERPFVHTLAVVREPVLDGKLAGESKRLLTFEVRSIGPNGVRGDDDDMWIEYEVQTREDQVVLFARRWGGIGNLLPEDRVVPRDWTDSPASEPEFAPSPD